MKEKKNSFNISTLIILLGLIVIGIGIYFLNNLSLEMKETRQSLAVAKKDNEAYNEKQKALDGAITELKNKSAIIAKLNTAMPMGAQVPDALVQIDAVMSNFSQGAVSGVNIKNFQIGMPVDNEGKLPVTITIDASLGGLVGAITVFHNNLRPFTIDSFNITAKDSSVLSTTMTIGLMYTPPNSSLPTGGTTSANAASKSE